MTQHPKKASDIKKSYWRRINVNVESACFINVMRLLIYQKSTKLERKLNFYSFSIFCGGVGGYGRSVLVYFFWGWVTKSFDSDSKLYLTFNHVLLRLFCLNTLLAFFFFISLLSNFKSNKTNQASIYFCCLLLYVIYLQDMLS